MGITEILKLLGVLAPLARDGIAFWTTAKNELSRTDEWTPEYDAIVDAEIAKIRDNPEEYQKEQPL